MRLSIGATALLCALVSTNAPARAQVTLPNGDIVPRDSNNGETQLFTLFSNRGESIDWIGDANATPDTFSPLCDFQATFVLAEAGSPRGIGWYNVVPGATTPPAPAEVYQLVGPGQVGQTITGTQIRTDANYAGGLVGFALIKEPGARNHFSQVEFNTQCTACSMPGPWHLALTYASDTPNAFYLAFEDGGTDSASFGNDGDYNDAVFFLEGLVCAGAGEACEVPDQTGVCVDGITECERSTGDVVCKQLVEPSAESCDGFDNDCNGDIDDGEDLCSAGEVCNRGVCVPRCGTFEFQCVVAPYTLCSDGLCIEPECDAVECNEGEACIAGVCTNPCTDVVCPVGRVCRVGQCVDPCAGVQCPEQQVCQGGACVLDCECVGCAGGLSCDAASKRCVPPACEDVSCPEGNFCAEDGSCVDVCADAVCPAGNECVAGACTPVEAEPDTPAPDDGAGESNADAGSPDEAPDGGGGDTDGGAQGGTPPASSDGVSAGSVDSGCSCHAAGLPRQRGPVSWWGGVALLGALAGRRRAARGRRSHRRRGMNGVG